MEVMTMATSVVKNRQPDAVLTAKKDKFAVEMALLVTLEAGRDVREEEQLANICYITIKSGQLALADTNYFIKPIIWVRAESITLVTMQRRAKYSLHEKVDRMSVGHKRVTELTNPTDQVEKSMEYLEQCANVSARASSVMYNKTCSTVFNSECKNNNIYETVSIQQCHTCTYPNKQCRGVDEQVGITMTLQANCCSDKFKQMQNMFAGVRDLGTLNKAT